MDAEGAIWFACPFSSEVIRVREGGEVTHHIKFSRKAFACMLGGPDRRTLFILTAETGKPGEAAAQATGRVEIVEVEVPGAGIP